MPAVLNAANENAVYAFLEDKLKFLEIADYAERIMSEYKNIPNPSLDDIIAVNDEIRRFK